jgi:hypothetical protein
MSSMICGVVAGCAAVFALQPVLAHHSHAMFELQTWSVEMSNIQNMIRRGIGSGTFAVGEHVTVTMHPLVNGNLGGNYVSIVDSDGTEYD